MGIKKTYNRFLSICLIVALGAAFFAGVRATNPDMQMSADAFFDESNLMDIRVLSTLGLTRADAAAILEIDGVEAAVPAYSQDVLAKKGDNQLVIKLMSVTDTVNLVTVDEGRMPQSPDECLADNLLIDKQGYGIGDTITVMSGDDTDIDDIVNTKTFTIVGRGRIASYLNLTRDSSQIGSGSVNGFLMIPAESFSMEAYTEIAVTVKDAAALDCYGKAYEEKIADIVDKIEAIADTRCEIRYNEVVAEAADKINDAQKEVDDGQAKLDDAAAEIADGEAKLADAKAEVEEGEEKLADARAEVADGEAQIASAKAEVSDGEAQIASAKAELENGEEQIASAKAEVSDGEAQIASAKAEVADGEAQIASAKEEVDNSEKQLADAKAQISENERLLSAQEAEYNAGLLEVENGRALLSDGWETYEENLTAAQDGLALLEEKSQAFEEAVKSVEESRTALEQARLEIEAARDVIAEGENSVAALEQQLSEIDAQTADIQASIEAFEAEYGSDMDRWDDQVRSAYKELFEQKAALEASASQISDNISEINRQLETARAGVAKFEENEQQLLAAEAALGDVDEQRKQIADQRNSLEYALSVTLPESEETLLVQEENLNAAAKELDAAGILLAAGRQQLLAAKQEVESGEAKLADAKREVEENEAKLADGKRRIEENEAKLADAKREIEENEAKLAEGKREIEENEAKLADAKREIEENEAKLADGKCEIEENEAKLADAKKEIEDGEKELADGKREYEEALEENEPKLADARAEIADAWEELLKIKMPEWYVLDRDYIQTCVEYAQDAERIGKIGDIFPVIFFLVAALVSLTTMTRMVEEERTQIGTLKALGYSKVSIAAKYVLYAFFATMLGGIAGTVIGQKLLPVVIMRAYSILYVTLTDYKAPLHFGYTVTALLAAVISTTAAVIAACYKELLSVPAQLMRPVAPKAGKRVWLERVTFIWKRLNFSNKAAMRNLFRYKKRFFMTIIGIGGCMGLLLVGFGLKDSIMTIGDRQYNDIRTYDSTVTFSDDSTGKERSEVYESILNEERTAAAMMAMEETVDVSIDTSGKGERSAYLFVPSELERMDEFIVLQSRIGHERYALDNEGAVISEKLAKLLEVSEGDEIYLEISDMNRVPVKVSHIVENYYFHYVYLSPSLYETIYGKAADYSEVFVEFDGASVDYEDEFSGKYLAYESVSGVSYTRTMSERISEMIRSMDAVIYVIIISAGLLAFVVLYNLNNINISERRRELATLKVLGFYDGEVSIYVLRENIMLTLFGVFAGVFFGIALHRFVVLTAELDLMMFGRDIYLKSYIYSVLLTFAFSGIVNAAMHWKLKKTDMIESLKSVE